MINFRQKKINKHWFTWTAYEINKEHIGPKISKEPYLKLLVPLLGDIV